MTAAEGRGLLPGAGSVAGGRFLLVVRSGTGDIWRPSNVEIFK